MTSNKSNSAPEQFELLTVDEVAAKLRISRMQLYRLRKDNKFVRPVMNAPLRWRAKDIDNFFDQQIA